MTHITSYPTKRAFREAVSAHPDKVFLDDPAVVNPLSGSVARILESREIVYVTNHPRRSWFANVRIRRGRYHVE